MLPGVAGNDDAGAARFDQFEKVVELPCADLSGSSNDDDRTSIKRAAREELRDRLCSGCSPLGQVEDLLPLGRQ